MDSKIQIAPADWYTEKEIFEKGTNDGTKRSGIEFQTN
jgi:hypothetical protein